MRVQFNASQRASLGVEWELQLVDRGTRALSQTAVEILEDIRPAGEEQHPKAKHELFRSTVEIITGVCQTVAEARADIEGTLSEVTAAAARRDVGVVCAGTHPFTPYTEQEISPNPRYHTLVDRLQWPARGLAIYGVHVHVGIRQRRKIVPIVNALTTYIPQLLALTSSSPYWGGEDTGMASARAKVFEGLPTAGLPLVFRNWRGFEDYIAALIATGTIETIREVWWDIRPHPNFGTVEVRVFDGVPTVDELMMAAALTQSLVQRFDEQLDQGYRLPHPTEWVVKENKWRAMRYGLDADLILDPRGRTRPLREEIERMLTDLEPVARRLGCADELRVAERVLTLGPSYVRQRRAAAAADGDLTAVVDLLATEMANGLPR